MLDLKVSTYLDRRRQDLIEVVPTAFPVRRDLDYRIAGNMAGTPSIGIAAVTFPGFQAIGLLIKDCEAEAAPIKIIYVIWSRLRDYRAITEDNHRRARVSPTMKPGFFV